MGEEEEQGKGRKNDDISLLTLIFDGCGNDRKEGELFRVFALSFNRRMR